MNKDNLTEQEELELYIKKLSCVANLIQATTIPHVNHEILSIDEKLPNPFKLTTSVESVCDIQNIPKWWRLIYNWGSDIRLSLTWSASWMKLLEERRVEFLSKNPAASFLDFTKSLSFDSDAWINSKYYLDNAIMRIHSYRDKIAWLLNSHSALCILEDDSKVSFYKYFKKSSDFLNGKYPEVHSILCNYFISDRIKVITSYYRHNFVHNETPYVDFPKEAQAHAHKKMDSNGKIIEMSVPIYGLQPPDFELVTLFNDSKAIWTQFVEGTNQLYSVLLKTYYLRV